MNKILMTLLVLALAACGGGEQGGEAGASKTEDAAPVRTVKITTATVELRDIDVVEEALGRVLDPATTTIAAEISARVDQVHVDIGDRVEKGAVLARLDASDVQAALSTAEANLAREEAQVEAQSRLVARYRTLADEKFVSTTTLDQAEAQLIATQKAARAASAGLDQARNNLARTRITAPVSGTVQQRFVAPGDYIGAGKPMFQLVTDDHFVISVTIPETRAAQVRAGMPVRMHLPGSDTMVEGEVSDLSPMVGARSNGFEARVKIRNPGNWRPGGSVIVQLIAETRTQAVAVPEECVVLRPAGDVVYVIEDGRARAVSVQTGVRRDGYAEIVEGLAAGVTVAATGASFLSDGAAVTVQESSR